MKSTIFILNIILLNHWLSYFLLFYGYSSQSNHAVRFLSHNTKLEIPQKNVNRYFTGNLLNRMTRKKIISRVFLFLRQILYKKPLESFLAIVHTQRK
jgi:hypothetical protein